MKKLGFSKTVLSGAVLFLPLFLAGGLFAGEEVHSFYISNHDQSPSHRVIHPIVGKTNFVYDAKGRLEEIRGQAIAFLVRDCENVTIRNLRLDYARPMLTEAKIAGFEGGKTILEFDSKRCPMMVKGGELFMVGEGFTNQVRSCRMFDGETREQTPEARDVFLLKKTFVQLPDGKISVNQDLSKCGRGCRIGDIAVLRPDKRDFPAIVVYNSKNTVFEDVVVHDAKGMVLIAQRSENVTWRGTGKAEDKTSGVFPRPGAYATSHADATHFSNVKGAVVVENSWFEGMMDDAINVHSTCLAITNVSGRTLTCRYMHHQAVGFEVFKPGETLRFMNGERLENGPEVKVAAVNMLNEREVEIIIDQDVPAGWGIGDAVENADYQCAATFRNNIVRHNRARGTLFTTPKPVLVESNLFYKVTGAPLLFSGDNYYWYESGACRDVIIRGNVFSNCYTAAGGYSKGIISFYPVVRNPGIQQKCYHGNVLIEDNTFSGFDAPLLFALSVENLVWRNNRIDCRNIYSGLEEPAYIIRKCRNVMIDGVDRSSDSRMDTAGRVETDFNDGWAPCAGTAAMCKRFTLPASAKGQSVFLDVDGAVCGLDVFLNGVRTGSCASDDSCRVNLAFAVKDPDEENLIEIRPTTPSDCACAKSLAGMCRGLKLVRTAPIHVGYNGVSITTKTASDDSVNVSAKVNVKGPMPFVKSISPVPEAWGGDVRIENRIVGEDGMVIKSPKLSTAQASHIYQLETKLFYVGKLVDTVTNSFQVTSSQLFMAAKPCSVGDAWAKYVPEFNRMDDELYANAISNSAAEAFLRENAPSFSCPDEEIERIYHFRWWTYRKHLRRSAFGGWVVTEFLPDVSWAGADNTISCPLGHQIREGRWLRNGEFIRDHMRFMTSKGTINGPRSYTCWPAASLIDFAKVTGDFSICESLLGRLVENYEAWEKGWISSKGFKVGLHSGQGLFHQRADREGTEYALSPDGARPMVNSAMWAEANAIAYIAKRKGENAIAERFEKKAKALADAVRNKLWNEEKRFFTAADTNGVLSSVCELHGYAPFYFGMLLERKYASVWSLLTDESGFLAPKGLVFPARNTPGFTVEPDYAGHECLWNGPSWPYATSIALSALCGELQSDRAAALPLKASDFVRLLKQYAAQHHLVRENGVKVPWIDENLHPFTGEWLARHIMIEQDRRGIRKMRYLERGKDYNHSTFCDLVISGLCGLVPREDGRIEVKPLAPESWDWWRLDGVRYHGHNLTILFDRDGSRYGKGKGLVVLKDGLKIDDFKR